MRDQALYDHAVTQPLSTATLHVHLSPLMIPLPPGWRLVESITQGQVQTTTTPTWVPLPGSSGKDLF